MWKIEDVKIAFSPFKNEVKLFGCIKLVFGCFNAIHNALLCYLL